MNQLLRAITILVFAGLFWPGITNPAPVRADGAEHPALWRAESGNSALYIFGTFHLLEADTPWLSAPLQAVFEGAESITLETSEIEANPTLVNWIIQQRGLYSRRDSLQRHLPQETWAALERIALSYSLPLEELNRMRPWYASVIIAVQAATANGFLPDYGVENILQEYASRRAITVEGLELAHEQISTLADQPKEVQVEMLQQTMSDIGRMSEMYDVMVGAWLTGDEALMAEVFLDDVQRFPSVYESLFVERNANWVAGFKERLSRPGTHLIAVGAAHLVGPDSVIELLRKEGIDVIRVK